jgi:RNA polymerase sigma factor (sigma-70 family)
MLPLCIQAGEGHLSEPSAGPDQHLFRRFLEGEPAAVARVESLVERVVRFRGYFIPAAERADLIQEVMLDVWQLVNEKGFALTKNLDALVRSVSYRTCVDWVRRRRPTEAVDPQAPDETQRPDREALEREKILLGRQVLRELRLPCRDLFDLFVIGQSSYRDIAERQGRTEGAVRTQMAQCLKEARDLLDRIRRRRGSATWRQRRPA